ncbi:hypothetical protein C9374_003677 [Naegleria lovaniensis]|uniref:Uncharacterized protein n=1 Tax=Naegleria lovaniensis TaxID=51637 RepID=A0AA88H3M1_NAELO|nr:uncharacterized protein C9374_003677 [Naegleria lovaniensis]KAG2393913.1 hypothetical protein C9374_003677 [Naegleria lovaniensis]
MAHKLTFTPVLLATVLGMMLCILATLVSSGTSQYQPLSEDEMKSLFTQFTHKHNKFYQGPKEYQQRFEIFSQNVEKSRQMNILEGRNTYGVTKFSDLSPEEFSKYYLMKPKTPQQVRQLMNRNGVLPISKVSQQQVRDAPKVEQQLVDCDHNCVIFENQQSCDDGCNGGLQWSAYQYIIQAGGIASEDAYPYYAESYKCTVKNSQFVAKLQNWTMLSTNETELAAWLAENGPIAVALNADWLQNYNNGIGDPAWCDPTQLDHGVLLVGYGVETFWFGSPEPYWIVKNSWGEDWGEMGYFRIIRNKGRCGINTVPSTSVV